MTPTSVGVLLRIHDGSHEAFSIQCLACDKRDMLSLTWWWWCDFLAFLQIVTGISHLPWPESFACCLVNNLILLRWGGPHMVTHLVCDWPRSPGLGQGVLVFQAAFSNFSEFVFCSLSDFLLPLSFLVADKVRGSASYTQKQLQAVAGLRTLGCLLKEAAMAPGSAPDHPDPSCCRLGGKHWAGSGEVISMDLVSGLCSSL